MGRILVLAGPNGAGKSSVAGAALAGNTSFFNPDEQAARLLSRLPDLTVEQANSWVWYGMRRLLRRAPARCEPTVQAGTGRVRIDEPVAVELDLDALVP